MCDDEPRAAAEAASREAPAVAASRTNKKK
jgi:hypothetical protein